MASTMKERKVKKKVQASLMNEWEVVSE